MPLLTPPPIVHEIQIPTSDFIDRQQQIARDELNHWDESLDNNWNLGEYFGCIYVINLPQADQRREQIVKDLAEVGSPPFTFFEATDGRKDLSTEIWKKMHSNWAKIDTSTNEGQLALEKQFKGEAGCFMSHYRILKEVKEKFEQAQKELQFAKEEQDLKAISLATRKVRHYSSVLILEDDNGFGIVSKDKLTASLKNCGKIFRQAMSELPKNWDMLYFMAYDREKNHKISEHLVELSRAILLNAYALNHTVYEDALRELQQIEDPFIRKLEPVDNTLGRLHKTHFAYAISPTIAFQRSGKSSITSKTLPALRQLQAHNPMKK